MSKRLDPLQVCMVAAALTGMALFSSDAVAQQACCQGGSATGANMFTDGLATSDNWPATPPPMSAAPMATKDQPATAPSWWTHGEIEFGWREFLNNPMTNGALAGNTPGGGYVYLGQNSLAKYYQYNIVAPGAFGGGHIATGSNDGLYQADLWANNIGADFEGFSDQSYLLNLSQIGEQYLTFQWDETPNLYSTSAQTPFLGIGSNALTLPAGFTRQGSAAGIIPFLYQTDIGIQRNTAAVNYRWTPPDPNRPEGYAWDLQADYSHMDRTGTQAQGVALGSPGGPMAQVPAPVNDTTQNFGANGEYAGLSPWNQKYTFKLAYAGSVYTDHIADYTVQNPFTSGNSFINQMSTPPSNNANGISGVLAADLPSNSRYVGVMDYTLMRQDGTFQAMTDNPAAVASPVAYFGGAPWNAVNYGFINGNPADPTTSLNGQISTFVSNNTLTTHISPDLTSKLTYRYYDFDNQTPQIVFPAWVVTDGTGATTLGSISSLTMSYVKQNAGAELNWRPSQEWNFNGGFGYERYDYTPTDVNTTNEYSGKLSADWKPTTWLTARVSGSYADRRYDNYDYDLYVASIQYPTIPGFSPTPTTVGGYYYSSAYQQFMFDNRERTKANFALDVVAFRNVTVSPTFIYQDDYYGLNPLNQEGVNNSQSLSAGVDVAWAATPHLSLVVSYYYQLYNETLYNYTNSCPPPGFGCAGGAPGIGQSLITTSDKEHVNTVTVAMNWAAIPGSLNLNLRYALSDGIDEQAMLGNFNASGLGSCSGCGPLPNDTTLWERLDATATYKIDPSWYAPTGFTGEIKARLRYTWERNIVNNWQNDPLAPFTSFVATPGTSFLWLAYENPNYTIQMLAASLVATW
jgi:hypothetical protein